MIINRHKKGESTLCTYTTCGSEIREGHVLGYGDNYPCIVLYNKFEGRFDVVEFGYSRNEGFFRHHDLLYQNQEWKILFHIDEEAKPIKGIPDLFDYSKTLEKHYK